MNAFLVGILIGASVFSAPFGIVGWFIGYERAMRRAASWIRPKTDKARDDVPNLAPLRERRAFPTTPGRSV